MGIACRKWVTFHGLALNVTTDLSYFARINPCGFEANVMTSLAAARADVDRGSRRSALVEELGALRSLALAIRAASSTRRAFGFVSADRLCRMTVPGCVESTDHWKPSIDRERVERVIAGVPDRDAQLDDLAGLHVAARRRASPSRRP